MKVGELREKLSKMTVDEITKLTVEFYKLIPKAKKENYNIDELIENPVKKKTKKKVVVVEIEDIDYYVSEFIADARDDLYIRPNKIISKKERTNWRFKVKKWYKELLITNREDLDLEFQAEILLKLYQFLCESCHTIYFNSEDVFESIGIEQKLFFRAVLNLLVEAKGKKSIIDEGISLSLHRGLSYDTTHSDLMNEVLNLLNIPDLKIDAINKINEILSQSKPKISDKNVILSSRQKNDLAKFGFIIYASLGEYGNAIKIFKKNYHDSSAEVKLFVLVKLLFREDQKELIKKELDLAIKKKINLRGSLVKLHQKIIKEDSLPADF